MNHVVVPLSAIGPRPFVPSLAAVIVVVHMLCVGLPIALVVCRHPPASRGPGRMGGGDASPPERSATM
jgi:hypothetical protein